MLQHMAQPQVILVHNPARLVFKIRTSMIDVKTDFKSKYDDMTCSPCGLEEQTFDHLFKCNKYKSKLKETLDNKFNPKWIHGKNIEQMKPVALTVEKNFENKR